jgi:hypothetical protein
MEMTSMMQNENQPRSALRDCVVAAIETGARFRGPEPGGAQADPVERLIAIIESDAARLRGNDFSALNSVLAGQALALDTMFAQLARESVGDNILDHQVMRLALRAQSQSRTTLDSLVSVARPRAHPGRSQRNFDEQTVANRNSPSR